MLITAGSYGHGSRARAVLLMQSLRIGFSAIPRGVSGSCRNTAVVKSFEAWGSRSPGQGQLPRTAPLWNGQNTAVQFHTFPPRQHLKW